MVATVWTFCWSGQSLPQAPRGATDRAAAGCGQVLAARTLQHRRVEVQVLPEQVSTMSCTPRSWAARASASAGADDRWTTYTGAPATSASRPTRWTASASSTAGRVFRCSTTAVRAFSQYCPPQGPRSPRRSRSGR